MTQWVSQVNIDNNLDIVMDIINIKVEFVKVID